MTVAVGPVGRRWPRPGPVVAVVVAALVAAPVVGVVTSLVPPRAETWSRLWATRLPGQLVTTVVLTATVAVGALVLGTALAWLVTAHTFPGRRALGVALALPLAMPAYVLAFVVVDTFAFAGPVARTLRAAGVDARLPEVRSLWAAALVLIAALYPYVYLLARAAFREQSAATVEAARVLGATRARAFWRVVLPLARPSLAAGVALVVMEVLTDIGTVRTFNVSTVADGVLRTWYGRNDLEAATELASLLVAVAVVLAVLERRARGRARFDQRGGADRRLEPVRLHGWRAAAATGACLAVLAAAFAVPVGRLVAWSVEAAGRGATASPAGGLADHVLTTALLALAVAGLCTVVGLVLAGVARFHPGRTSRLAVRGATAGYAVPGPVVAMGVLGLLAAVDRSGVLPSGVLLTGSMLGLGFALLVRFAALGHHAVDASLTKVTPAMEASARTLGAGPLRTTLRVHLPLARTGVVVALGLVVVDVAKELPATLLLRPTGHDTLAVWVWNLTAESQWVEAAVPGLAIVALALVPLLVVVRAFERGEQVAL